MHFSLHSAFFFSVHGKQEEFSLYNQPTAILRAGDCLPFLKENVSSIGNIYMECVLPQTLNGPHGGVVTTMVLGTAPTNIEQFSYNNTNFLSCMTLDVENLHVSVHHKK